MQALNRFVAKNYMAVINGHTLYVLLAKGWVRDLFNMLNNDFI
jgi:hypothetical protein